MSNIFRQTPEELKNEIDLVWGGADFGILTRTQVIRNGILKCASGYSQGHTSQTILEELGMISKRYNITDKGKYWLWRLWHDTDI